MKNSKHQFRANEQALIQDLLTNGRQDRTWQDLAAQYGIVPMSERRDNQALTKAANDVWRRYNRIHILTLPREVQEPQPISQVIGIPKYHKRSLDDLWKDMANKLVGSVTSKTIKPKRLYYDIETSYNIVKAWRIGFNINLNMDDIIHERAIITIAYKWEGSDQVEVLTWDKGCDKRIIQEFVKVVAEADELVGHNVDRYDTKFIMFRALKHDIPVLPKYQSTDTLKLSKKHFMLNSNKLDYIAQYLGIGHKTKHRGLEMWDDIILRNDAKAMQEMVDYNIQDVILTEKVYKKLMEYSLPKVNHAAKAGGEKHSCPQCGTVNATLHKTYSTGSGNKTMLMSCNGCSTNFTINQTNYNKHYGSDSTNAIQAQGVF